MEKYLVDLFVASAQEEIRAPGWMLRLYFALFSAPLGKTLRIDMVKDLLQLGKGRPLRSPWLEGKRVLDVGCGIGDLAFMLAERGAHVVGVELDAQKVARASRIAERWHFDALRFLTADATKIDQMNLGQFDAIFCLALLEHIEQDVTLLQQLHGLLRPGGTFVLEVPSAQRKTIAEVEEADGHKRPGYLFEEVPSLLESTGFRVIRQRTMDPLGLIYYWCMCSRIIPLRKARRWLFTALAPLFISAIRLTSALIKRPGAELCFLAVKM